MSNGHCGRITRNFQLHQDIRPSFEMGFLMWQKHEISPFQVIISTQELGNIPGWWLSHPSEKYEFVSWDDDIPNQVGKSIQFSMVPKYQPDTDSPKWSSFLATPPPPGDWCNWWKTDNFTSARRRISASQCSNAWPGWGNKASCPREQWDTMAIVIYYCIWMHTVSYDHCDL